MLQTIPICSEDAPFLFDVYASTRLDELRLWGWDPTTSHHFLMMQWNAQQRSYEMQYPDADHRLILFQNQRAGRILTSRCEQFLTLIDLSLLPAFRNQGIGTQLLKDLQQEAAASNKTLRLSVLQTNPAKNLYARLGFHTTGENGLYDFMEWRMASL